MSLIIDESFQINNYISISNTLNNIPLFFLYFNPIQKYKNIDQSFNIITDSTNNFSISNIKFKHIYLFSSDNTPFNFNLNFHKSLYHSFISANILLENNISFIISQNPFVLYNDFPILNNFSYSLNFNHIHFNNLKSYFSQSLLDNPYIPIDIYLISYLTYNNISIFNSNIFKLVIDDYCKDRENMDINFIISTLQPLINYNNNQIIKYLFQFKYTWSNFSLISFFLSNYKDLLITNNLFNLFQHYLQQLPKNREKNIINNINNILFVN
jgi:hypothetical protein